MNVSNVPLQEIENNKEDIKDFKEDLERLRNNEINDVIYGLFKNKISNIKKCKTIIVCGGFAKKYFDKYQKEESTKFKKRHIFYVPHPSRNQWEELNNYLNLNKIKKKYKKQI